MSLISPNPKWEVTTITLSPSRIDEFPLGIMILPWRLMHAIRMFGRIRTLRKGSCRGG